MVIVFSYSKTVWYLLDCEVFLSHGIISVDQEETITIGKNVNN